MEQEWNGKDHKMEQSKLLMPGPLGVEFQLTTQKLYDGGQFKL